MGGLSLKRNFSWTLAANLTYTACQWGMLVVLARLGSPEAVGRFALGFAVSAPVMMFANLQLSTVLASDVRRDHSFADYLALRIAALILGMLVIGAIVLVSGRNPDAGFTMIAIGLAKAFESLSDVHFGLLQLHERMDISAKSMLFKAPLALVVLCIVFYRTRSVAWAATALAITWALVLVAYDMRTPRRVGEKVGPIRHCNPRALLRLAMLTLPLGFVMMLVSLNYNIPRYFVERYLGESSLGIFSAMVYSMAAGTTVVAALAQAAVPRLAKHYGSGDKATYRRLMLRLVAFGTLVGGLGVLLAVCAGRQVLGLFYGPEYAREGAVFVVVAAAFGVGFVQRFLDSGMTVARRFRVQVPLYAAVSLVTTLGCLCLIPNYRLMGAAIALLVAAVVLAAGAMGVNLRILGSIGTESVSTEECQ